MNKVNKFKIFDKNDTKGIIGPFDWNKLPNFLYPENFILLQFTNIYDSDGKEIYEGDILSINGLEFVCEWRDHGFIFKNLQDERYIISINERNYSVVIKVIKNIYEK